MTKVSHTSISDPGFGGSAVAEEQQVACLMSLRTRHRHAILCAPWPLSLIASSKKKYSKWNCQITLPHQAGASFKPAMVLSEWRRPPVCPLPRDTTCTKSGMGGLTSIENKFNSQKVGSLFLKAASYEAGVYRIIAIGMIVKDWHQSRY